MASKQGTATVTAAVAEQVTAAVAIDPAVVKQATNVIGAVGAWSELMESTGSKYFTTIMSGADKALVAVGPSIETARDGWALLNPTRKLSAYTAADWIGQVAAQRPGQGWSPSDADRRRLDILFTLAIHGHSAQSQAHYVSVAMADIDGTYGVADIDGYVSWLPNRADYQHDGKDLDVRSEAAEKRIEAARAAAKAEQALKSSVNLTGHMWDTLAPEASYTDTTARDEHLAKLLHDFTHYVTSTIASHGDDTYVRSVNRSVANAVKARRQATTATPRAAK